MKKIGKYLWNNFELIIMQISFWALLACVCSNIILRWVFNHPLFFAEELSRIFFVWMCFWGFGYVQKRNNHIRLTLFTAKFPKIAQTILDLLTEVVSLAVFIWIFKSGIEYIEYVSIRKSSALQIPMPYLASVIPLTSSVMIIRIVCTMLGKVKKLFVKRSEEAQR